MVKVSIVIPTYKGENTITRAIDSVQQQSFSEWEIIIVDDNSSESLSRTKTESIILGYQSNKIKYIKLDSNSGAGFARNIGVKEAASDIIAFLDDDDEWYKNKLVVQYNAMFNEDDVKYCICHYQENLGLKVRKITFSETILDFESLLNRGFGLCTSAIMVDKSSFMNVGGFDECLASYQDYDLLLKLSKNFRGIVNNIELLSYKLNAAGISMNFMKKASGRKMIIDKYEEDFIKYGYLSALAWQYENLGDFLFLNDEYKAASSSYDNSLNYQKFSLQLYFKRLLLLLRARPIFLAFLKYKKRRRYNG